MIAPFSLVPCSKTTCCEFKLTGMGGGKSDENDFMENNKRGQ